MSALYYRADVIINRDESKEASRKYITFFCDEHVRNVQGIFNVALVELLNGPINIKNFF